jgi:hypothetical protein
MIDTKASVTAGSGFLVEGRWRNPAAAGLGACVQPPVPDGDNQFGIADEGAGRVTASAPETGNRVACRQQAS